VPGGGGGGGTCNTLIKITFLIEQILFTRTFNKNL
jgi:hypothetical protein